MKKEAAKEVNLLELKPVRNIGSETTAEGLVVLMAPKFQDGFFARWLMPRIAKPHVRVKLDAYGSFIWNACDGQTTVHAIAERMNAAFGDDLESLYDRIGKFMRKLDESKFILIDQK